MNKTTHRFTEGLHLFVLVALLAGLLGLAPVPVAHAATHTVCAVGCDFTTIQAAINDAGTVNGDTISVMDAVHTEAGITVDKDLTIQGQGQANTTVQANAARGVATDRVFDIVAGSTVTIKDMTIQHGNVTGIYGGGGINNEGTLTVENVTVKDNDATASGGGIEHCASVGTLTVTNSTVSGNTAGRGGGGINHVCGTGVSTLTGSTVSGNTASGGGGGIYHGGSAGALTVTNSTVSGNTATTSSGGGIYHGDGAGALTVTDSTVSGNTAGGDGGGIGHRSSAGALTVTNSTVSGNTAGGAGGGIYHAEGAGALTVTSSTVSGNTASGDGGGVGVRHDRIAIITNSTVSGNTTNSNGGGVALMYGGTATMTNSTVSGNKAHDHAGGISSEYGGTANLNNVTVTDNTADFDNTAGGDGGGLRAMYGGTINVKNSIIAGNSDPTSAPDCSTDTGTGGSTVSAGYNLVGKSDGCNWTNAAGDQVGTIAAPVDPQLGALGDNGGPTQTHALLAGSPAIDAIPEGAGGGGYNGAPATDQRGVSRPQPPGGDCDIGAFEAVQFILTVNKAGAGTGTVTSDPAGILCGSDCTEYYVKDMVVTLTATPDASSGFVGWSGDCSGTNPTTTVTMDADKTCTATFETHILTVNTAGAGTGTVTSEPAGIFCGADCTENYPPDTVVTLTAHPGVKSYFVGWSGDCSGTDRTTQVTMDADKTCTATFGYPVGGIAVPVNKVELLAPWLGLVTLAGLAALGIAVVRSRVL